MHCTWLLLACLASVGLGSGALAATTERHQQAQQPTLQQAQQQQQQQQQRTESSNPAQSIAWLGRRIYEDCQDKNDFLACLKQKALHALVRALEQDSIKIVDGLVLEKQNHTEKNGIIDALTDARQFSSLAPIDRALLTKADKLLRTHALTLDMSVGRGHDKKKKKKKEGGGHIKYVIAALLTAMGIAGPIGLKALAAIAGKALVISKVALTIAGIIALKKLFSHDHSEETSFQVHSSGDHNRRSTYVIRPVSKPNAGVGVGAGATGAAAGGSVDPYRYYYEYHQ